MKINKREFLEFAEGKFKLNEIIERDYEINIEQSLKKLAEIKGEINKIPLQIENLEKQKLDLIKFYNDGVEVLEQAKEHYKGEFEELELPAKL